MNRRMVRVEKILHLRNRRKRSLDPRMIEMIEKKMGMMMRMIARQRLDKKDRNIENRRRRVGIWGWICRKM